MKKIIAATLLAGAMLTTGCDDPDTASRVLVDAGYTQVVTTGYDMFGCSKDDDFSTGFKAIGPTGRSVEGVVCSSLWAKGATIRLY